MQIPSSQRLQVAQDLHDGIAQDLIGIGYSLDLLLSEPNLSNKSRAEIRAIRLTVNQLNTKVRTEILALRSSSALPLTERIKRLALELAPHHEITFELSEVTLKADFHGEILLIVSEILRNSLTHAGATHLFIALYPVKNRTCLELIDNGIGGAQMKDGHFGLAGISERVKAMGGDISIDSIDGTRIAILI